MAAVDTAEEADKEESLLSSMTDQNKDYGDFDFGGWRVEPSKLQMRAASGRPVALSEREIAALRIFAAHPGEVFGRDYLVMRLWGADAECTDNNLSVMLYALRRKFGRAGCGIACVRGVGYAYRP